MRAWWRAGTAIAALTCGADAATAQGMAGMTMPGMTMPSDARAGATGTDLPPGKGAAPPPARGRLADAIYDPVAMAAAERRLCDEHGGMRLSAVRIDLAEVQGDGGYRWNETAWIGGDIDRLTIRSEGEGGRGGRGGESHAEVQALYGHAIDPYWTVTAGVREDLRPGRPRSYAAIGIAGLAPYWIEVEGDLFLSGHGDLLGRIEAYHDARITQDIVLQPRIEIDLAAQDVPAGGIAAGLSEVAVGVRLRYERARRLAPYVGMAWARRRGDAADSSAGVDLVAGVRAWF